MRPNPKILLDRDRDTLRLKQFPNKTEQAYLKLINQYILFHGKKPTRYRRVQGRSSSDLPYC